MVAETAKKCARSCQVTLSTFTILRKTSWTRAVACRLLPALSLRMYLAAICLNSTYTLGVSSRRAPWSPPLQAFNRRVTPSDSSILKFILTHVDSFAAAFQLTGMKEEISTKAGGSGPALQIGTKRRPHMNL